MGQEAYVVVAEPRQEFFLVRRGHFVRVPPGTSDILVLLRVPGAGHFVEYLPEHVGSQRQAEILADGCQRDVRIERRLLVVEHEGVPVWPRRG